MQPSGNPAKPLSDLFPQVTWRQIEKFGDKVLEIGPRTEGLGALPGENRDIHFGIGLEIAPDLNEPVVHRPVDRVHGLGTAERDSRDSIVLLVINAAHRSHGAFS